MKFDFQEIKENIRNKSLYKYQNDLNRSDKKIIVLSSDCVGGRLMKDYALPSYTPMINNHYSAKDFIKICQNPDYYFSHEVEFAGYSKHNHPMGRIDDVCVIFGHSSGYEESLKKWKIGCKNYFRAKKTNNYEIIVICNDRNGFMLEDVNGFESLPYKYKVNFVHTKEYLSENSFYMKNEDNFNCVKTMTSFESRFSIKRRYDRYDFYKVFKKAKGLDE